MFRYFRYFVCQYCKAIVFSREKRSRAHDDLHVDGFTWGKDR